MKNRFLDAKGQGQYDYDYTNDILLFKVKKRDYLKSIDFGNFIVDFDKEMYITGMRIFDASKIFRLSKYTLSKLNGFEFNAKFEDNEITVQLRFEVVQRNKPVIKQGQDFSREVLNSNINESEVLCTVA